MPTFIRVERRQSTDSPARTASFRRRCFALTQFQRHSLQQAQLARGELVQRVALQDVDEFIVRREFAAVKHREPARASLAAESGPASRTSEAACEANSTLSAASKPAHSALPAASEAAPTALPASTSTSPAAA
jgi:hypothetical protein